LLVSPHPDDIAFSLGGLIGQLKLPATLLTLFGRSNYTVANALQNDEREITLLRREEDRTFAKNNSLQWCYHEFPAAGLRFGGNWDKIFDNAAEPQKAVRAEMPKWNGPLRAAARLACGKGPPPAIIMLPAGLGNHHDHLLVREIFHKYAQEQDRPVAFYEDLPYALDLSESEIKAHMTEIDGSLKPQLLPFVDDTDDKVRRTTCYRSQVDEAVLRRLRLAGVRYGISAERIWSEVSNVSRIDLLR
jgi:LmbE family N-acetylglucosaminyl deacetylase